MYIGSSFVKFHWKRFKDLPATMSQEPTSRSDSTARCSQRSEASDTGRRHEGKYPLNAGRSRSAMPAAHRIKKSRSIKRSIGHPLEKPEIHGSAETTLHSRVAPSLPRHRRGSQRRCQGHMTMQTKYSGYSKKTPRHMAGADKVVVAPEEDAKVT